MVRCFDVVRKDPAKLVSVVRIIEREEKYDTYVKEQHIQNCGRPKSWRKKFFDKLFDGICDKVSNNQLESRNDNKMWLVRHLEVIRC